MDSNNNNNNKNKATTTIKTTTENDINCFIQMSKLSDYDLFNQLGQGTFGVVTKARQKSSGKLVAIKKFIITDKKEGFPITAFREITIMKKLKNINILQIIDMIHDNDDSFFYTVCPYISSDLNGLLNNPRINLSLSQIKCLINQILLGINYVHQSGYLHRDIKTANILLDNFGIVKIADFGLARLYHGNPPKNENSPPGGGKYDYTGLVVTRWYRPPELLLGDRKYTTAVDIWGIGCVFGELFTKKPILEGKSDIHQAELIFKLLGSPTIENFPNCHLINRNNINLKINYSRSLESNFKNLLSIDAINLLSGMLTLDPLKRFNAIKCLNSNFFKTSPLPCEIIKLSNLEESHESDVKRFKDELKSKPLLLNNKIPTQPSSSNPSLNHSKYGSNTDIPNSIPISNSNSNSYSKLNNIPNKIENDQQQKNFPSISSNLPEKLKQTNDAGHQYKYKLPKHQINQIQQHIQSQSQYNRAYKRSYYDNDNDYYYGYQNDYYYNNNNNPNNRINKKFKSRYNNNINNNIDDFRNNEDEMFSSNARGRDLYGSNGTGDTVGLSALTKVLMKNKQKPSDKTVNNTTTNTNNNNNTKE